MASHRSGRAGSLAPSEEESDCVSAAGDQEGGPPQPLSRVAQLQGRNQLCYPIDTLAIDTVEEGTWKRGMSRWNSWGPRSFNQFMTIKSFTSWH